MGRLTSNLDLLRWEHLPLIWATPTADSLYKDTEESFCSLLSPCWQVHAFIDVKAYFGILMYTGDQLRHTASWTEKLQAVIQLVQQWLSLTLPPLLSLSLSSIYHLFILYKFCYSREL